MKRTTARAKKARTRPTRPAKARRPRPPAEAADRGEVIALASEIEAHPETNPTLSGGDVDADWVRAYHSGDEAVGGSVATPDQDVVDEIGHALGVEQAPDAEVQTSEEILRERDRSRWQLDHDAADSEEGRAPRRPRRRER